MSFFEKLRHHPFPVVTRFEQAVALSFAFPEATLRPLVPQPLAIDTHQGFGFLTVAMVWTKQLRPAGFPSFLGQDFFLAGYRVFTRLRDETGRSLRGLKILRSETDKRRMVWAGNLFTDYHYRHVNLRVEKSGSQTRVETSLANGARTVAVVFEPPGDSVSLPEGSPFGDWHTARLFAGPMPFTFSPTQDGRFVVIEGSRQNWIPKPIQVKHWAVSIFDEPPFQGTKPILANAFMVENVPYQWKSGRIVRPGGPA